MELRTYVLIDSMQPQYAALTGVLLQGDIPVEGMAEVFMELAPASDVYEMLDAALKTTEVRPGLLRVEREYGTLEIHGFFQEDVKVAGREALGTFGLTEADRWKPEVVSVKMVTNVDRLRGPVGEPDEPRRAAAEGPDAVRARSGAGGLRHAGRQRGGKGVGHHAGALLAVGRFGRLYISGTESAVKVARDAAVQAVNSLAGKYPARASTAP